MIFYRHKTEASIVRTEYTGKGRCVTVEACSDSPRVGIFWLYEHDVAFMHAVPLAEGLAYGDAVGSTKGHADYWEELRSSGGLEKLPVALRDEYFHIPRGRVVFRRDLGRFYVYHGNNVTRADLEKVRKAFGLNKSGTSFEQDLHYCDLDVAEWESIMNPIR